MKNLLDNPYLALLVRVFVGLLFVVSSLEKIVDPAAFAQSIANYKMVPEWLVSLAATILPWLELLCGFSVLFGALTRGSSFLLSAMLVVFTLAVIVALARGLDISCGCFTQDPTAGKIGWLKILQNATLIVLTLFLYFSNSESFTLLQLLQKSNPGSDQPH
ncbi:MAG: MauE/DoxX family redox-associated membrane protein [Bacteroidota bacterium]|jgi:uncharacterized membrane protein YphA (DoxX/SURF4 family)